MHQFVAILCMSIVAGSYCYEDIHKYMSREELQRVFHTDADEVPEYEVVKLHFSEHINKRDLSTGQKLHLRAFGEDINLWLHPRDSVLAGVDTPVYYAKQSPAENQGVEFTHREGMMGMVGKIFEDPRKRASLVIGTEEDGTTRVNGFVESDKLMITSLPLRVADVYRKRRSVPESDNSSYHIVSKTNLDLDEAYSLPPVNETRLRQRFSRDVDTTEYPDILYPEILVVVDNSIFKAFDTEHGHDVYGLLEYLLAFWNGVDLKYRSLEAPKFRLNIAAIILSEDPGATPYISEHMESDTAFNFTHAMTSAHRFFYYTEETFPLDSFDVVAIMTRHYFGLGNYGSIAGAAVRGGICDIVRSAHYYGAISFSRDDGTFQGAHVVAHELGHVFDSGHDNGNSDCTTETGFVMAFTPWYTTNSSDFSSCSIERFQARLDKGKYTCLLNKPKHPGTRIPELMPGRIQNLAQQCRNEGFGVPCRNSSDTDSVCVSFYCRSYNGKWCMKMRKAALDGTACEGENKFCLHQQCVSL